MAKYTVELRTIVDSGFNIFNFPYSFYDDTKKTEFEQQFIRHFKYREICCETVGRWQDYLRDKIDTTLPYYNMLYNTALIDYEKTKNYNMVETFERDVTNSNNLTGNATVTGNTSEDTGTTENTTGSNTLNRSVDNVATGVKDSALLSDTDHTENVTFERDQEIKDKATNTKTSEKSSDLKKVHSDTPQSLLSAKNIDGNIFASDVEINDNGETAEDTETLDNTKTDKNTETTEKTVSDKATGSSKDTTTETIDENTNETNSGTNTSIGSRNSNINSNNISNNSQEVNGTETENTTRTFSGSYGVITEADMLKKHIDLQSTLTKITAMFFDDCEDLFMQVY